MSTHDPSTERELKLADAALLALRAGLAEEGEPVPNRFVVRPGAEPIPRDAAAALLARRPKPLRCTAVLRDGYVQVDCAPFEPSTRAQRAAWLVETARQNVAFMRETYAIAAAEEKLLLRGVDESVRLSMDDFERWASDYECGSASYVVNDADDEARAQGATAVMKFFAAGGLEFHVYPPL